MRDQDQYTSMALTPLARKTAELPPPIPLSVPKGRFELPRGYPHYALNVARLPVPPLRHMIFVLEPTGGLEPPTCCLRNSCSTG